MLDGYQYLVKLWDELNPPAKETDLISKVVGFIFYVDKGKQHLFLDRIKRRYLDEENGPVTMLLIESLLIEKQQPQRQL